MTYRRTAPDLTLTSPGRRGFGTAAAMLVAGSLLSVVAAVTPPANAASGQGAVSSHVGVGGR